MAEPSRDAPLVERWGKKRAIMYYNNDTKTTPSIPISEKKTTKSILEKTTAQILLNLFFLLPLSPPLLSISRPPLSSVLFISRCSFRMLSARGANDKQKRERVLFQRLFISEEGKKKKKKKKQQAQEKKKKTLIARPSFNFVKQLYNNFWNEKR